MQQMQQQHDTSLVADAIAKLSQRRRDTDAAVTNELQTWARNATDFKANLGGYCDTFARSSQALGEIQQEESSSSSHLNHARQIVQQKENVRNEAVAACERENQQLQAVRARDLRVADDMTESYTTKNGKKIKVVKSEITLARDIEEVQEFMRKYQRWSGIQLAVNGDFLEVTFPTIMRGNMRENCKITLRAVSYHAGDTERRPSRAKQWMITECQPPLMQAQEWLDLLNQDESLPRFFCRVRAAFQNVSVW